MKAHIQALQMIALAAFAATLASQQIASAPDSKTIFERTKAATVIVLAGEGAGRLNSIATGVVISKDGVILTALHAVKGAAEVQVPGDDAKDLEPKILHRDRPSDLRRSSLADASISEADSR